MSLNAKIITPPVSMDDVRTCISCSYDELEMLCRSNNINKWARYKPVRYAKKGRLTEAELKSVHYGLTPVANDLLLDVLLPDSGHHIGDDGYSWKDLVSASHEWTYTHPSGGATSPYRLTDFAPAIDGMAWGYKHDTRAPMSNFGSFDVALSYVQSIANDTNVTVSAGTGGALGNYVVSAHDGLYANFAARIGDGSADTINNTDTYTLPITYLLESIYGQLYYRLGLVVVSPLSGRPMLVVGAKTFYEVAQGSHTPQTLVQDLCPTLCSNQYLCKEIVDWFADNPRQGRAVLKAVPVIVANAYFTRVARQDSSTPYVMCIATETDGNVTSIYSVPSESREIDMIVSGGGSALDNNYEIGIVGTNEYVPYAGGASWGRVYINRAVLRYIGINAPSTPKTIYYKASYTYVSGFKGQTPIVTPGELSGYKTVPSGTQSGEEILLYAAPGLSVSSYELSETPFV